MIIGHAEDILRRDELKSLNGCVQLIFTSPPFPLNRKKRYGNKRGDAYIEWLSQFAVLFNEMLTPDGSIVIEMGNAWVSGSPTQSTLAIETLLSFIRKGDLHLCQEFIWYNPARLPSPVQWVNKERIRVKDSFTRFWWVSPCHRPKADNRRVLREYSDAMKKLLRDGKYSSGRRPSEHHIGDDSFLKDNGGAIPPNVLTIANTSSNDPYCRYCKDQSIPLHPARMPTALPEFFIRFLTERDDLVLDPFGGSNTTGAVAESLGRRWLTIEPVEEYVAGSRGRFDGIVEGVARAQTRAC